MRKKPKNSRSASKQDNRMHFFKHHPFAIPVMTFVALFVVSVFSFLIFGGETIGASDSKVVRLHVDGKQQIVPTRAQSVGELLERRGITVHEKDIIEPALDTPITVNEFEVNVYKAKPVLVIDGGNKTVVMSAEPTPEAVAEDAGLTVYPEDRLEKTAADLTNPTEAIQDGLVAKKVVIERATPVKFSLYGKSVEIRTHAKTVGELLAEKNIELNDDDTLQPTGDTELSSNLQIFVVRYGTEIDVVEEEIEMPVDVIEDPNLPMGTVRVQTRGTAGLKTVTYEIELENGREVGRTAIQETTLREAVTQVEVRGTKVIISNPSENVKLGQRIAEQMGWSHQFHCIYSIFQRESGWNHLAQNRSSGAYGIPQALPGTKMGPGWQSDPEVQIRWGIGYMVGRYGSPCEAQAFWNINHWY
jgi:resuscitation-promoting factor RpfB